MRSQTINVLPKNLVNAHYTALKKGILINHIS